MLIFLNKIIFFSGLNPLQSTIIGSLTVSKITGKNLHVTAHRSLLIAHRSYLSAPPFSSQLHFVLMKASLVAYDFEELRKNSKLNSKM
jgi:hypothetical protein